MQNLDEKPIEEQLKRYKELLISCKEELEDAEGKLLDIQRDLRTTIPVFHDDKILLVKLNKLESACYAGDLAGNVIAECTQADDATYILDFIN